jgi:putative molybdopterin biosynthesis protein
MTVGRVPDVEAHLQSVLQRALDTTDLVLVSGGTSKGAGDVSYRCLRQYRDPGVLVHGVALKPGKPLCLAVTRGKAVVLLPGFPTSAIFTFHEFVAPLLARLSGVAAAPTARVDATLPVRLQSERGRTEFVLVSLVPTASGLAAYPMGKGSGSVTAFSFADGFTAIDQGTEWVPAGTRVTVQLLNGGGGNQPIWSWWEASAPVWISC